MEQQVVRWHGSSSEKVLRHPTVLGQEMVRVFLVNENVHYRVVAHDKNDDTNEQIRGENNM